jgi:hypothetical protein
MLIECPKDSQVRREKIKKERKIGIGIGKLAMEVSSTMDAVWD